MQESGISYEEVYEAYWQCLKHKGNTIDAIRFEINAEEECRKLTVELNNRTYRPSRSIVFISEKPVKREIFGAAFRDRVVDTVFARRVTHLAGERDDTPAVGELYGGLLGDEARYAVLLYVTAEKSGIQEVRKVAAMHL